MLIYNNWSFFAQTLLLLFSVKFCASSARTGYTEHTVDVVVFGGVKVFLDRISVVFYHLHKRLVTIFSNLRGLVVLIWHIFYVFGLILLHYLVLILLEISWLNVLRSGCGEGE